ncbi:PPE domain-containing protein [Mycolicibacterium mengxianglii]|uniref:PPE domain-containing protein n=1 Tax=Mycolicibacterium mengxianglii TaxID=2736649 RepID=UPI0018EF0D56|nr:PPE domain-containing protein [Mycolicibacterium mengxianglii]
MDPLWPISRPEDNYTRLMMGTGTATTLANMSAWLTQLASHEASFGLSALNTAATMTSWQGVGAAGSAQAGAGLNAALQLLAGWVTEKPPIASSAVAAYEAAVSSMIPAPLCVENRVDESSCQAINPLVLGGLTPRIIELNMEYFGGMWPNNSRAGVVYGAALAALTAALTVPPPVAPMGASPAAPAAAAAAVAEAAGNGAAGQAMQAGTQSAQSTMQGAAGGTDAMGQMSSMVGQAQGLLQPLTGLMQMPMQAAQQGFGAMQGLMGPLTGMFGSGMKGPDAATDAIRAAAGPGGAGGGVGGAGGGAGSLGGSVGGGAAGHPGAGLTSFTRPTSSFDPAGAGRATGLKPGFLDAAEMRGPTTGAGTGGMPMSPGMLHRGQGDGDKDRDGANYARVVVDGGYGETRRD